MKFEIKLKKEVIFIDDRPGFDVFLSKFPLRTTSFYEHTMTTLYLP